MRKLLLTVILVAAVGITFGQNMPADKWVNNSGMLAYMTEGKINSPYTDMVNTWCSVGIEQSQGALVFALYDESGTTDQAIGTETVTIKFRDVSGKTQIINTNQVILYGANKDKIVNSLKKGDVDFIVSINSHKLNNKVEYKFKIGKL